MSSGPLAQGRKVDLEDREPVEEVLAELALRDRPREVAVRGRDDAHVGLQHLRPAEPLELALLEDAQELRLHGRAHLAHLVEEERAAGGLLETARLARRVAPVNAPFS